MSSHPHRHVDDDTNPIVALCNLQLDQLRETARSLAAHGYGDDAVRIVTAAIERRPNPEQPTLALPEPKQPTPAPAPQPAVAALAALTELDLAIVLTALMRLPDLASLSKADRQGNRNARDIIAVAIKRAKASRK